MPDRVRTIVRFRTLYILLAAVFWYLAGRAHQSISDIVTYAPGVDLAYLPAGVRLILILVLRVWGAVGITIANPALFITEVNRDQFEEFFVSSIICGFAPLITLYASERALAIGSHFVNISPHNLTLISLEFSSFTPVSFYDKLLLIWAPGIITTLATSISHDAW